jgi:hypothetical protein
VRITSSRYGLPGLLHASDTTYLPALHDALEKAAEADPECEVDGEDAPVVLYPAGPASALIEALFEGTFAAFRRAEMEAEERQTAALVESWRRACGGAYGTLPLHSDFRVTVYRQHDGAAVARIALQSSKTRRLAFLPAHLASLGPPGLLPAHCCPPAAFDVPAAWVMPPVDLQRMRPLVVQESDAHGAVLTDVLALYSPVLAQRARLRARERERLLHARSGGGATRTAADAGSEAGLMDVEDAADSAAEAAEAASMRPAAAAGSAAAALAPPADASGLADSANFGPSGIKIRIAMVDVTCPVCTALSPEGNDLRYMLHLPSTAPTQLRAGTAPPCRCCGSALPQLTRSSLLRASVRARDRWRAFESVPPPPPLPEIGSSAAPAVASGAGVGQTSGSTGSSADISAQVLSLQDGTGSLALSADALPLLPRP